MSRDESQPRHARRYRPLEASRQSNASPTGRRTSPVSADACSGGHMGSLDKLPTERQMNRTFDGYPITRLGDALNGARATSFNERGRSQTLLVIEIDWSRFGPSLLLLPALCVFVPARIAGAREKSVLYQG
jgi:hypothetical protein